ncbi:MAG: nitrile hydratase accessory protein [Pseudomonadota bacterium]|nr:nitrile hydratase accessory protein [Pseudomonadota bacterium]
MRENDRPAIGPPARDDGEPAFEEPWQAHVLAVAYALAERGSFSHSDWSQELGAELQRCVERGEADSRATFFAAALSALQHLVTARGMVSEALLDGRTELFRRAYLQTPHGKPIEIEVGPE